MPATTTRRGPKRSASWPANAPTRKYRKPEIAKTSETSPRFAANSSSSAPKNAAKEYATPKMTTRTACVAATTIQP